MGKKKIEQKKGGDSNVFDRDTGSQQADVFENPVADSAPRPATTAVEAFENDEKEPAASTGEWRHEGNPLSPAHAAAVDEPDLGDIDLDAHLASDADARLARRTCLYLVFMAATVVLFPVYFVLFLFIVWLWYVVPNSMSAAGVVVALVLPAILIIGFISARKQKMPMLRFYAFLMMLAVNLQVSVCIMVAFDKSVAAAYLSGVVVAGHELCATIDDGVEFLPLGVSLLPNIRSICSCFKVTGVPGSSGSWSWNEVESTVITNQTLSDDTAMSSPPQSASGHPHLSTKLHSVFPSLLYSKIACAFSTGLAAASTHRFDRRRTRGLHSWRSARARHWEPGARSSFRRHVVGGADSRLHRVSYDCGRWCEGREEGKTEEGRHVDGHDPWRHHRRK